MLAAILHEVVHEDSPADEADVLVSRDAVSDALLRLGHEVQSLALGLDLAEVARKLREIRPSVVVNLVDAVDGTGRLNHLAPSLLERLGLAYTGVPLEGIFLTTDKLLAKRLLKSGGVPTPGWVSDSDLADSLPDFPPPYIVKPLHEDASVGLDDSSVVTDAEGLRPRMDRLHAQTGGRGFVEAFVEGRELNISLLEGPQGVTVLPPAEIRFVDFPEGKPKIVNYAAKWAEDSFEYANTLRSFDLPGFDPSTLQRVSGVCLRCWDLFNLRGYARVDLRVDAAGVPWVLEVNANPCISPDAGFPAAAARAGIPYTDLVQRIIESALRRHGECKPCKTQHV